MAQTRTVARVVIGESERLPDLGEMLHRDVILGAEQRIANFLAQRYGLQSSAVGEDVERTAPALARLFLNMATGPQRFATVMEARKPAPAHPSVSGGCADAEWVRLAVRFFLSGLEGTAKPKSLRMRSGGLPEADRS